VNLHTKTISGHGLGRSSIAILQHPGWGLLNQIPCFHSRFLDKICNMLETRQRVSVHNTSIRVPISLEGKYYGSSCRCQNSGHYSRSYERIENWTRESVRVPYTAYLALKCSPISFCHSHVTSLCMSMSNSRFCDSQVTSLRISREVLFHNAVLLECTFILTAVIGWIWRSHFEGCRRVDSEDAVEEV
jgi:hypothetical protein